MMRHARVLVLTMGVLSCFNARESGHESIFVVGTISTVSTVSYTAYTVGSYRSHNCSRCMLYHQELPGWFPVAAL